MSFTMSAVACSSSEAMSVSSSSSALPDMGDRSAQSSALLDACNEHFQALSDKLCTGVQLLDAIETEATAKKAQAELNRVALKSMIGYKTQTREQLDKLTKTLMQLSFYAENNNILQAKVEAANTSLLHEQERCQQAIADMQSTMHTAQAAHKAEIDSLRSRCKEERDQVVARLEKEIEEQRASRAEVMQKLSAQDNTHQQHIVRLRLEYEQKIAAAQQTEADSSRKQQTNSAAHAQQEIFRKKLLHAKAQSDQEIARLRKRVQELEREVSARGRK